MDFLRIRFQTIGLAAGLVACLALLGSSHGQVPAAAAMALALLLGVVSILLLLSRRELQRLTKSNRQALARAQRLEKALQASDEHARAALETAKRQEEEMSRLHATLELRVRERTAALEAINRELEHFSYSVSHDLRSPLRHINGYAELLQKSANDGLDASTAHYLEIIVGAAKRASTLVEELLAFSRMGRTEMRYGEVDMGLLVDDVRRDVEGEAQGRDVRWYVGPLPPVRGDASMLKLALRNLVSNALKFSRPRAVAEIRIESERVQHEIVFRVRDNGVGFDMAEAGKLFGVFKRLHPDSEFEGTGIGLANVRRIVERHGGRTWGESRPGEGATFSFAIPDPGSEQGEVR